ncbi:zinc metallopeptidase 2 MEP2 [Aphelenchoides avenae]|nr:zinc metallopeptidase 2 MEP2 [Aphelenchus avenae]
MNVAVRQSIRDRFTIGRQRRGGPRSKAFHRERDPFEPRFLAADADAVAFACAYQAEAFLQYALARVFTDVKYPTADAKAKIKSAINATAIAIKQGMQTMIDGLDWMDDESKKGAYAKVRDLIVNVAYPDFITDDAKLDAYYNDLTLNQANIYDMFDAITIFSARGSYKKLDPAVKVDRNDFLGPPTTTNAWYQPELNSITFPEGILNKPYFDPDWPSSINLGAMGVISGHELTHGFDDEGVQWNSQGGLEQWMSDKSFDAFKKMASCVVKEYGSFCPLDATKYTPNCLNGQNTQGENIADNGGIHAAYRAYRNHIALNGPDPRLPDAVFGKYSHDQLFFMSFSQVWCQLPETDDQFVRQILRDPHSPSIYRVLGTIRNFPAFRTAFNCPVGTTYAPKSHCPVWVPTKPL